MSQQANGDEDTTKFTMQMNIQEKQLIFVFDTNAHRDIFVHQLAEANIIKNPTIIPSN